MAHWFARILCACLGHVPGDSSGHVEFCGRCHAWRTWSTTGGGFDASGRPIPMMSTRTPWREEP